MTEAEWLASSEPTAMLRHLENVGGASDRRLRLLAVALASASPADLTHAGRCAVLAGERLADGGMGEEERSQLWGAWYDQRLDNELTGAQRRGEWCAFATLAFQAMTAADQAARMPGLDPARGAALLRDIFGNPYRQVALCGVTGPVLIPAPDCDGCRRILDWNGGAVVSIAREMYESRQFGGAPVLADALEEAGCASEDLLRHLRDPGPHARGCWAVDLILGKQ